VYARRAGLGWVLTLAACASWQRPGELLGARPRDGGGFVNTREGHTLYVERRGQDQGLPPVLLVHGFASNHEVWETLEPALRASRRTLNVDLPGFGWSSRREGDYSPTALAGSLVQVLDQAQAPVVDVVAHSWGSAVALALALEHPARVRRVVLLGAWVYDEQLPPFFRWARAPGVGEMLFTGFYQERPAERFPVAFEDASGIPQTMVDAIEESFQRAGTSRAALAAARGQCFLQLEGRYPSVRQPVLLVWGAQDRVARLRFGERLARELPDATLEVLPRVGHFPMLEAPHRTRSQVQQFLGAPAPSAAQGPSGSQGPEA
jgi:pimeloyl-ACP methyl ester carboxylesterase